MDVRCARCGIEYEFDDALISDRGTMVRCTECGHQFRVHPSHVIPGAPDEWRIVTPDGQTIVYLTLRELQQGITQGQVGRDANLIRGNSPARPLGTIAELDPFFPTPAGEQRQQSTLTGVAPPSLAPTQPKTSQSSARTPIARIGLNTVQVSASGVALEAPRLMDRPRKTTLGMGEDPQKLKEVALRAREAAQATSNAKSSQSEDKTQVDAPVAPQQEVVGATKPAALAGKPEVVANQSPVQNRNESAQPPVAPNDEMVAAKEAPVVAKNAAPTTQEPLAQKPSADSPKLGSANAATPKLRPKVPGASDPPATLRNDASEASIAKKRPASSPPRPEPRNTPTPGSRLATATQAAAADRSAALALPLTVKSPSKPPTDPPPAVRGTQDETRFQQLSEPPALDRPEAAAADSESPPRTHEIIPPPASRLETGDTRGVREQPSEDSVPLEFQAESPPIERPPVGEARPAPGSAAPATAIEPESGSFMPTVPPKRLLTNTDALLSAEKRASGSRMGRWLMVGLFVVLLSLVALWFNPRGRAPSASPAPSSTVCLEQYLSSASAALHAGDLGRAHDQLQSSQTLGGRDPRWIALTARYNVMRADMNWLAVRLADPNDAVHADALKRELADHVAQASLALMSIERLSVKDPQLGAVRVDAQRLRGEIEQARMAAQALRQPDPTPELAYTLAGVELLAEAPNYSEVFEWLGRARAADAGLGRAPALLVLACVMSERIDCARAELARLKSAPKSHPLLPDLEAFVNRAGAPALQLDSDASTQPEGAVVADAGAVAATTATPAPDSPNDLTGDFRLRLRRGMESLSRNELTRAEQLFRSVIAERPSDTEALTGLGDVARRRNNTASAMNYYQKVLATNGQYLPALSALADVKWRSGDRAGAVPLYRRILDQVGDGAGYGQTAAQRLREFSEAGAKPSSTEPDKAVGPADATRHPRKQP